MPRSWFLNTLAHEKEAGLLREMADYRPKTGKHVMKLQQRVPERAQMPMRRYKKMTQDPAGRDPHMTNLIIWAPKKNNDSNYALNNKEKSLLLTAEKYIWLRLRNELIKPKRFCKSKDIKESNDQLQSERYLLYAQLTMVSASSI